MPAATGTYVGADGQTYQQGQTSHTPVSAVNTSTPDQTQTPSSSTGATYIGVDGQTYRQGAGYLGPVSTSNNTASQVKPVGAVFSAKAATDYTNNVILPTIGAGMAGIGAQNDKNAQNDLTHFLPGETAEAYNQRVATVNAAKNGGNPAATSQVGTQKSDTDKAAEQIANTPEPGNQFIYDNTGQRLEVPVGSPPPAGYTTTAPANPLQRGHTVVTQFNDENGTTYQQYSDGTYGVAGLDGTYAGSVTADQYSSAQTNSPQEILKGIATGLASIKNGALPLSAPQQAQIDALQSQLATAVSAQQKANENYTGATTVAMNLYGMGNSVSGMGIIKGTVDDGVAKILDLQTKAAGTIAQMQEAFDKDNYDRLFQYYNAYAAAVKGIDDNISAMHTQAIQLKEHADTEADNLRSFNQKVQQDAITNKREDALAASTMATQALERQKTIQDINATNEMNAGLNAVGGSVMGANGQPDPNLQAAYLQTVAKKNPGLALSIKAAAEYRLPLTPRFFTTKAGIAFTQQMLQYDPTWDATNYASKQATVTNFATGKYSQQVTALNTASQHIATLTGDIKSLGNVGFVPANFVKNSLGQLTGVNSPAGVKLDISAVTGEMSTAFKASGATDQEIKDLGVINSNSSPQDVQKYVKSATALLASKLNGLNDTYVSGVGKPPPTPLLRTDTQAALSTLKNQGYDIQVPGVIYTDPVAFQKHDPQASQKMDAARTALIANGIPPTPENILQAAQLDNQ